tara:strand:+ start:232 stop:501 length:270 start_codon:yes stop_codon:yes gene_type:complete
VSTKAAVRSIKTLTEESDIMILFISKKKGFRASIVTRSFLSKSIKLSTSTSTLARGLTFAQNPPNVGRLSDRGPVISGILKTSTCKSLI